MSGIVEVARQAAKHEGKNIFRPRILDPKIQERWPEIWGRAMMELLKEWGEKIRTKRNSGVVK